MAVNGNEVQYRYYDMPPGSYILALLGNGWIRAYGDHINMQHFHNYFEIGYCYEGNGHVEFGQDCFPYGAGTFTLIPANFLHHTQSHKGNKCRWEFLFVDLDTFIEDRYGERSYQGRMLADRIKAGAHLFHQGQQPQMRRNILEIIQLYRYKPELYLESAKGILWNLLVQVALLVPEQGLVPEELAQSFSVGDNNSIIVKAISYIAANYREKVQISDLAASCHLSETHFRRVFSQCMQTTPLEFLNLVRVEAACKLLRSTNDPIHSIAVQCGFTTLASFNRNFKAYMDTTPGKWRTDTAYYERTLENQHIIVFNGWR